VARLEVTVEKLEEVHSQARKAIDSEVAETIALYAQTGGR